MALGRHDVLAVESLTFHVLGEPVSAPRQSARDAFDPSAHVQRYRAWKDTVRLTARKAALGQQLYTRRQPWEGPVALSAIFFLPVPASWPIWKRKAALEGLISHTVKPDYDNLMKAVKDALNGELWVDDAQVCRYWDPLLKAYSDEPKAHVSVHFLMGHPASLTRKPEHMT